jgi:hypothetical protein
LLPPSLLLVDEDEELSFDSLLEDDDSEDDDSELDDSFSFFFASFPLPFRAPEAARESVL